MPTQFIAETDCKNENYQFYKSAIKPHTLINEYMTYYLLTRYPLGCFLPQNVNILFLSPTHAKRLGFFFA